MAELYRNEYMTVVAEDDVVSLVWTREEPSDDHAVGTAQAVVKALDALVATNPKTKPAVLVDLTVVKRNFPRTTATYTKWLLGHRGAIRGGAFATKSFILRAGVSAAMLVPGLTMKGFSDVEDARKFIRALR